ncbi:hypothetical protein M2169_001866 [Streptomyces sp. MJP52]|nr:hypothetical protein [Streptomyces sp. MJP52]
MTGDPVTAREHGEVRSGTGELAGPAGTLRCSPADPAGRPRALREHRLARGPAPGEVAAATGPGVFVRLRGRGRESAWRGADRTARRPREPFRPGRADPVVVCGRNAKPSLLLRETFTARDAGPVRASAGRSGPEAGQKTDSASSMRLRGTCLRAAVASARGTITISVPCRAVIIPETPRCAASTACQPNRVARTRS